MKNPTQPSSAKVAIKFFRHGVIGVLLVIGACGGSDDDDDDEIVNGAPIEVACNAPLETRTTAANVSFVRTPDSCFKNLPDWPYAPKYLEIDGLRQAYIDVGPPDADPILLLHGQPTWSYLYRFMIPELVAKGHRVIAMDHVGMGRSDKPVDLKYHSFQNHVDRLETFVGELKLKRVTVFVQDWGSILGLYSASNNFNLFDRIVLANGGLPAFSEPFKVPADVNAGAERHRQSLASVPPQQPYFFDENGKPIGPVPQSGQGQDQDPFGDWIAYAMYAEDFTPSKMVEALTFRPVPANELAAYNAPFPNRTTMAGPRTFPSLVNQTVGVTGPALERLKAYSKPFLTVMGANEQGVSPELQQSYIDGIAGAKGQDHQRYRDGSHYVQDDKGKEAAEAVNRFIAANPL